MGWMTRFEPATSGSTDRRSNQLSYIHHKSSIVIILIFGRFCQKNFPPRFCKPGRTNKQPLIKSAAAGHKKPNRRANLAQHAKPVGRAFRKATPIRREPGFHKGEHPTQTRKHCPGQALHRVCQFKQARKAHRARVPQGRAMQTPPGVAQLFSRGRRLRGGQVAQALAHLILCQHPLFHRPQAHL